MKQLLTLILITISVMAMKADFSNVVFTSASGDQHFIAVAGLEITFADEMLIATNANATISLPLAQVTSMEFTNNNSNSMDSTTADAANDPVTVFTLDGISHGQYHSANEAVNVLPTGIYIIKYNDGSSIKISKK